MTEFRIRTPSGIKTVEGKRCLVDELPELELFVHRSPLNKRVWHVSEVSTGLCCPTAGKSEKEAVGMTYSKILNEGLERVKAVIEQGRREYGFIWDDENALVGDETV